MCDEIFQAGVATGALSVALLFLLAKLWVNYVDKKATTGVKNERKNPMGD